MANIVKSDSLRSKLDKQNTILNLYQDQYKSAINSTLDFNSSVLSSLSELRKEIKCEEVDQLNEELDFLVIKLVGTPADATLKGPEPGSQTVTNLFKTFMQTQRNTMTQSIDVILKVIKIAYSLNRPLLASKQALEHVFRGQKQEIQASQKSKFDEMFAQRQKEHIKVKETLQEQLNEANDEIKDLTKRNNQANEALRKSKGESSKNVASVSSK